jgi:glutathione S-transferase
MRLFLNLFILRKGRLLTYRQNLVHSPPPTPHAILNSPPRQGVNMKLYYSPGACSLASHIALHETGLPFEIEKVDFASKKTAGGSDFNQINPKGYVPTIKLDDGSILTEGAAVLQYIADQKPDSGLAPKAGTMERYRLQEWLTFIGTEIHKTFSPLFNKAAAEEVKTNARNLLTRRLGYVETQLANKPYLMGDHFTVADAYLFVVTRWSDHAGFDLGPFPRIKEYLARIAARPAVQAAMKAEGLLK